LVINIVLQVLLDHAMMMMNDDDADGELVMVIKTGRPQ